MSPGGAAAPIRNWMSPRGAAAPIRKWISPGGVLQDSDDSTGRRSSCVSSSAGSEGRITGEKVSRTHFRPTVFNYLRLICSSLDARPRTCPQVPTPLRPNHPPASQQASLSSNIFRSRCKLIKWVKQLHCIPYIATISPLRPAQMVARPYNTTPTSGPRDMMPAQYPSHSEL